MLTAPVADEETTTSAAMAAANANMARRPIDRATAQLQYRSVRLSIP
jgi:hypothetical protein